MSSLVSYYKDTNPIGSGPHSMTSFNINYFLTPNSATLGIRASTYVFCGGTHKFSPQHTYLL